jgi:hypothetical protein
MMAREVAQPGRGCREAAHVQGEVPFPPDRFVHWSGKI